MSALAEPLADYLRLRRTLGHKLADAARLLPWFVDYPRRHRRRRRDRRRAALAWALDPTRPAGSSGPRHRMTVVRGFARYMAGIDPRTEVPPTGLIRIAPAPSRPPFIYSRRRRAGADGRARSAMRPRPLRAHLRDADRAAGRHRPAGRRGACASTATTSTEAERVLPIRRSKFGKSRQVPLQPAPWTRSSATPVGATSSARNPTTGGFFVSLRGTRVIYARLADIPPALRQRRIGAGAPLAAADARLGTPSRSARCSAGIAPASTSKPAWRGCRPISAIETPLHLLLPVGRAGAARARRPAARRRPGGTVDEPDRPDPAGVLHRPPDQAAAGQPAHDRLLPRHARLLLGFAHEPHRQAPSRLDWDDLDEPLIARVPRPPRTRPAQQPPDPQPAADRDPVPVQLRRAAPPRARRGDPAGARDPAQALRQRTVTLPHQRRDRRADRRARPPAAGKAAATTRCSRSRSTPGCASPN